MLPSAAGRCLRMEMLTTAGSKPATMSGRSFAPSHGGNAAPAGNRPIQSRQAITAGRTVGIDPVSFRTQAGGGMVRAERG